MIVLTVRCDFFSCLVAVAAVDGRLPLPAFVNPTNRFAPKHKKDVAAYIKKEFDKKYNPTW